MDNSKYFTGEELEQRIAETNDNDSAHRATSKQDPIFQTNAAPVLMTSNLPPFSVIEYINTGNGYSLPLCLSPSFDRLINIRN